MGTVRLTMAQALVRHLAAQWTEDDEGRRERLFAGCWAIFGHGNVAGMGEALYAHREELPTLRAHNEQAMALAAVAYAKAKFRRRMMAVHHLDRPGRHQPGDGRRPGPCRPAAGAVAARRHLCQPPAGSGAAAGRGFRRRHGQRQ